VRDGLTLGLLTQRPQRSERGIGELDLGFWMFNFSPQLRDALTHGLRKRYSRSAVAGRVTAVAGHSVLKRKCMEVVLRLRWGGEGFQCSAGARLGVVAGLRRAGEVGGRTPMLPRSG